MSVLKNQRGWHLLPVLMGMLLMLSIARGQENEKLQAFLKSHDLQMLISKYGKDEIVLKHAGSLAVDSSQLAYTLQPGFRCQAFAGTIKQNALSIYAQLKAANLDSVYLIETPEQLFKVQLGNFTNRADAERLMLELYRRGFKDVWLVETDVRVPRPSRTVVSKESAPGPVEDAIYFGVQLLATRSLETADRQKMKLEERIGKPIVIEKVEDLYKLVAGRFKERKEAEAFLNLLRENGFEDAWITQVPAGEMH